MVFSLRCSSKNIRPHITCMCTCVHQAIRYSIIGFGTDEDTLTRAIISGSEIGMNKIKEEYKVRFKTTVTSDVVGDTSGYYKDFLQTLVGSED